MSALVGGCGGTSAPLAPERTFEGAWSGVTDQGTPIAFTVTNGNITAVRFTVTVAGDQCGGTITGGSEGTRALGFVNGRQFSALGAISTGALVWNIDGTFPALLSLGGLCK